MPQVTTFGPEVAHLQRAVGVERRGGRVRAKLRSISRVSVMRAAASAALKGTAAPAAFERPQYGPAHGTQL